MIELEQLVRDKSVALVGSAKSLLEQGKAQEIDAHDIVIRMNLSIPWVQVGLSITRRVADKVGLKTDVWCMGRAFSGVNTPHGAQHLLFMKLTPTGDCEWPKVQRRGYPCTRWPQALEDEVKEFVGADPGTGIRILWWLSRRARPRSVSVYGMDCWDTDSSWSGRPAPAHDPAKEKVAKQRLMEELKAHE